MKPLWLHGTDEYGKPCRLYPLADRWPGRDLKHDLRGLMTGEFRAPKRGEWYLSGAIPECYRAPGNLTTAYHIMRIVIVRLETVATVTGLP